MKVRAAISGDDYGFIKRAVQYGGGIGFIPATLCTQQTHEGKLVRVLPGYGTGGGGVYVVYPSAQHLPAKVRAFVDHMVAWASHEPWGPQGK